MTIEHLTVQMLQELVANAVTVTVEKKYRENEWSAHRVVNKQVFRWVPTEIHINGIEFAQWCESFSISAEFMGQWLWGIQDTKKAVQTVIVESLTEKIFLLAHYTMSAADNEIAEAMVASLV